MTRILTELTNVVGLIGNQSPFKAHHLDGVQADLKDVVHESQQWGERKRCHKYGGETELDHWKGRTINEEHGNVILISIFIEYSAFNFVLLWCKESFKFQNMREMCGA